MSYIIENVMLKQKIRADNVMSIILIINFFILAIFLKLVALMSIIVYPIITLFFYGIYKIGKGLFKKLREKALNALQIILGVAFTAFSFYVLLIIFSRPNVGIAEVIYLMSFPLLLVGIAGTIKGLIIKEYPFRYRLMNIIAGTFTIILTIMAFASAEYFYLFYIVAFSISLLINIIFRAIMYLSEYELSLRLRNFKYFFYILGDYSQYDINRMIELRKLAKE
ncbi:MAG: hypothetical protein ACFE8E_03550 [Candidatus Hodarchaeota archaeon]